MVDILCLEMNGREYEKKANHKLEKGKEGKKVRLSEPKIANEKREGERESANKERINKHEPHIGCH